MRGTIRRSHRARERRILLAQGNSRCAKSVPNCWPARQMRPTGTAPRDPLRRWSRRPHNCRSCSRPTGSRSARPRASPTIGKRQASAELRWPSALSWSRHDKPAAEQQQGAAARLPGDMGHRSQGGRSPAPTIAKTEVVGDRPPSIPLSSRRRWQRASAWRRRRCARSSRRSAPRHARPARRAR